MGVVKVEKGGLFAEICEQILLGGAIGKLGIPEHRLRALFVDFEAVFVARFGDAEVGNWEPLLSIIYIWRLPAGDIADDTLLRQKDELLVEETFGVRGSVE